MRPRIARALLGEAELKVVTLSCNDDLEGVLCLPKLPKIRLKGEFDEELIEKLLERAKAERKTSIINKVLATTPSRTILEKFWKLSPAKVLENPSCPEELKKEICLSGKNSPRLLRQKFKLATLGWEIRPKRLNAIAKRIRELVGPVKTIAGDPRGLYMFEEDLQSRRLFVSSTCLQLYRLYRAGVPLPIRPLKLFPKWVRELVISNKKLSRELDNWQLRQAVAQRLYLAGLFNDDSPENHPYWATLSPSRLKSLIEYDIEI